VPFAAPVICLSTSAAENLADPGLREHLRGMRMGNLDRRTAPAQTSCVVCGSNDARTLATTTLEDGARVTVCGSHKIAHRRAERMARSVDELRILLCDRRVATG
jgi:hypothetical protein